MDLCPWEKILDDYCVTQTALSYNTNHAIVCDIVSKNRALAETVYNAIIGWSRSSPGGPKAKIATEDGTQKMAVFCGDSW